MQDSSGHQRKHSTIAVATRGGGVEQLIHIVLVRFNGVDVLVIGVVGVHHHVQLTSLNASNLSLVQCDNKRSQQAVNVKPLLSFWSVRPENMLTWRETEPSVT